MPSQTSMYNQEGMHIMEGLEIAGTNAALAGLQPKATMAYATTAHVQLANAARTLTGTNSTISVEVAQIDALRAYTLYDIYVKIALFLAITAICIVAKISPLVPLASIIAIWMLTYNLYSFLILIGIGIIALFWRFM